MGGNNRRRLARAVYVPDCRREECHNFPFIYMSVNTHSKIWKMVAQALLVHFQPFEVVHFSVFICRMKPPKCLQTRMKEWRKPWPLSRRCSNQWWRQSTGNTHRRSRTWWCKTTLVYTHPEQWRLSNNEHSYQSNRMLRLRNSGISSWWTRRNNF